MKIKIFHATERADYINNLLKYLEMTDIDISTNVSNYYSGNITLNVYSVTSRSASGFEFNLSCSIAVTNANVEFGWFAIGRWK